MNMDILPFVKSDNAERKKPSLIIIALVVIAIFVLLICGIDSGDGETDASNENGIDFSDYARNEEKNLSEVLKKIKGAGNVSVYISLDGGGERILARNSKNKMSEDVKDDGKSNKSEENESTVVSSGKEKKEKPYVVEEKVPKVSGILVVADGAFDEQVRVKIYESVKALYGIEPHRIKITN